MLFYILYDFNGDRNWIECCFPEQCQQRLMDLEAKYGKSEVEDSVIIIYTGSENLILSPSVFIPNWMNI